MFYRTRAFFRPFPPPHRSIALHLLHSEFLISTHHHSQNFLFTRVCAHNPPSPPPVRDKTRTHVRTHQRPYVVAGICTRVPSTTTPNCVQMGAIHLSEWSVECRMTRTNSCQYAHTTHTYKLKHTTHTHSLTHAHIDRAHGNQIGTCGYCSYTHTRNV